MPIPTQLAKAKQLAVYWDNYVNYLSTVDDRQPNIGQGTEKPAQTQLFIRPFSVSLSNEQYISANGTLARWTTYGDNFNNHTKNTLSNTEFEIPIGSFVPARVVIKTGISSTKTVVTARTTKRKYTTRGGTSGSIPYGRNLATDVETTIFNTIKAAILPDPVADKTVRVSRVKEKS